MADGRGAGRAAAPLVGRICLERVFSPAQKWLTLKKHDATLPQSRSHPSRPLARSRSHPSRPRPVTPAALPPPRSTAATIAAWCPGRLFLCPSPLRAAATGHRCSTSTPPRTAPPRRPPGARDSEGGQPLAGSRPASAQRPPARPGAGRPLVRPGQPVASTQPASPTALGLRSNASKVRRSLYFFSLLNTD